MPELMEHHSYKRLSYPIGDFLPDRESKKDWYDPEATSGLYHLKMEAERSPRIRIVLDSDYQWDLPIQLKELAHEINNARSVLELSDDWDGEGSKGYEESTFVQATEFVINYALWAWEKIGTIIDVPRILPGPDGTIDLYWKKDEYDLLVNIPEAPNTIVGFYGDDKEATYIEGHFDIKKSYNQSIFLSLIAQ